MLKNLSMKVKLFAMTLPLVIAIVISVIFAAKQINSTEEDVTEVYFDTLYGVNSNLVNADRDFYQSLVGATAYYDLNMAPAGLTEDMIAGYLDDYKENKQQVYDKVGAAVKIAAGEDSLYTGTRHENGQTFKEAADEFDAAMKVWEDSYDVPSLSGNWSEFNSTFDTARDSINTMQEITETWADNEHKIVTAQNKATITVYSIVFAIIIALLILFVFIVLRQITSTIREVTAALDDLSNGDLKHNFPAESEMGNDELGSIHKAAKNLSDKLGGIIGTTKKMSDELTTSGTNLAESANQAAQASSQITEAVGEISQGAVGQAESVETAVHNTSDIGDDIEGVSSVIAQLSEKTDDMKQTCTDTMATMQQLLSMNAEVVKSMKEIHAQISATNDAVKDIAEASQIITDISSQTNLLSLNASIEAARAGESGRGFAVVATEIGSLADQSGNAAVKISQIVKNLVEESERSVATIEEMSAGFEKQNDQINATGEEIKHMVGEVNEIASQTEDIAGQIANLTSSKESLVGIISDLSAISEENAASAEETNASTEELNATFTLISESAEQLQQLANDLKDNISYFKD